MNTISKSTQDILSSFNAFASVSAPEKDRATWEGILDRNEKLIAEIDSKQNEIFQKRKDNPFMIFQNLALQVHSEVLSVKKDLLKRKNLKLEKKLGRSFQSKIRLPHSYIPKRQGKAYKPYKPIPLNFLATRSEVELEVVNERLDKLVEEKAVILRLMHQSPDDKLAPEKQDELYQLIREESRLLDQATMLEIDSHYERLTYRPYFEEAERPEEEIDKDSQPQEDLVMKEESELEEQELDEMDQIREDASNRDDLDLEYSVND